MVIILQKAKHGDRTKCILAFGLVVITEPLYLGM